MFGLRVRVEERLAMFYATTDVLPDNKPVRSETRRSVVCFLNVQYCFESVTV
jgi:hypothetical protein